MVLFRQALCLLKQLRDTYYDHGSNKCLVSYPGNKKDPLAFCWSERYKVAVGVAEALDYLHNTASQPVIHRDVKSSNILLSDDFEPQVKNKFYWFFIYQRGRNKNARILKR